jgi:peptidyl-prolyl cis-trans isomerase A (cyclophilin A)
MSENKTESGAWPAMPGIYAVITTSKGKIVCRLEYEKAPMTVGNFIALAEGSHPLAQAKKGKPLYDGLTFHRVIDKFMIQGGDPQGNGMGGPGYKFQDEFDPSLRHSAPGVLSMANSGANTNGSQFFITHVPTPWLDNKHTIFGNVVEGIDVVDAIKQGDSTTKVEIVRVGGAAEKFDAVHAFQNGPELSRKKAEAAQADAKKMWESKVKAKFPAAIGTPSGLYYVIDKEGTGEVARAGQTVKAHYTGTFFDSGQKFDSSVDRGQPFEFPIGKGRVIAGWDEGFGLLKVGTKGKLIIPYFLAYGEQGHPGGIPPKTDMIFEVELLGVK